MVHSEIGDSTWPSRRVVRVPGKAIPYKLFDNIEACWEEPGRTFSLHNPTRYDARVKILVDGGPDWQLRGITRWMLDAPPVVTLKPGERVVRALCADGSAMR